MIYLGDETVEDINARFETRIIPLERRLDELFRMVERLDKNINGNGRPPLEERVNLATQNIRAELKTEIQAAKRHAELNAKESDQLLTWKLEQEQLRRDRQHDDNQCLLKEIDKKTDQQGKKTDRILMVGGGVTIAYTIISKLQELGLIHFALK